MSHAPRRLVVGNFELLEPIADSPCWRARDLSLDREVEVKVALSDDDQQRLLQQAKLVASIQSQNVARVLSYGTSNDGVAYVASELLVGETLEERLARNGALDGREALRFARDIAHGLAAAHWAGVVHGRLDPAHVALVDDDADGEIAKLMDFANGDVAIEYLAPEGGASVRGDIYAFGKLLRRMVGKNASAAVESVIRGATAPDPNERYASMTEVLGVLVATFEAPQNVVDDITGDYEYPIDLTIASPTAAIVRSSVMRPRIVAGLCALGALLVVALGASVVVTEAARAAYLKTEQTVLDSVLPPMLQSTFDGELDVEVRAALLKLGPEPPEPEYAPIVSELVVTARPHKPKQITAPAPPPHP